MSFDALERWWRGSKGNRSSPVPVLLCLTAICASVFLVGVPALRYFGQDIFLALDGGWRVLNGQRPAADFLATMGPAWYLLYAGGMLAAGTGPAGVGWANAFAAILISGWAFALLRRRMRPRPFLLACIALALMASAPFPLGYPPWHTTFAMTYNRYGFALFALVLLECFLPDDEHASTPRDLGGAFSTGLACAVLLFLKVSYGLVALVVAALSVLLRPRRGMRMTGMIVGFAVFAAPMLAYLRFDLGPVVREYKLLASVRGREIGLRNLIGRIVADRFELALGLLAAALTILLPGVLPRRKVMLAIAVCISAGAGGVLVLGNAEPVGLPLMGIASLLLVNELAIVPDRGLATVLCVALAGAIIPVAVDATGVGVALADRLLRPNAGASFHLPQLASLRFADTSTDPTEQNENGARFVTLTEEGIALLNTYAAPSESVRGLAGANPFSYALRRPPSHGGAVSITDRKVSDTVVPPLDVLIGDVDLMLLPKFVTSTTPTLAIVLRRYPDLLDRQYARVAESENWALYRRRSREIPATAPGQ